MRTGTTAEGTVWTTRPITPSIEASFRCAKTTFGDDNSPGLLPCDHDGEFCHEPNWLSSGGKPFSPATPKPALRPALPPDVGAAFAAARALAVRRLAGLEPWPEIEPDKAPKLSAVGKGLVDPKFTKLFREFRAAVVAAGGTLALPIGTNPDAPVWRNPFENTLVARKVRKPRAPRKALPTKASWAEDRKVAA